MGIMQRDHIPRARMVSSWAGAMGQTQFMPSNYVDYAIDASGDGRADIWSNVADALGSTANYLHKDHWQSALPWGFEVSVPEGFDYMHSRDSFAGWLKLGVHPIDGKSFPNDGHGILFFPAGANGPAFIATDNYRRAQGVQQLRCLRDRSRPSRRPPAWRPADPGQNGRPTIINCRAMPASPCRRSSPRSAIR